MTNFYQTVFAAFLSFGLLLTNFTALAQDVDIKSANGRTLKLCAGNFYDSGGPNNGYVNGEDFKVTFCPDNSNNAGQTFRLTFNKLDLGLSDRLTFYDGVNTTAPVLDILQRGDNNIVPVAFSATRNNVSGCLTVVFESRVIFTNGAGWEAEISCIERCQVIQSELVRTVPAVLPIDTGYVDACIGQEITFEGRGKFPQEGLFYSHANSAQYFWDFGDGSARMEGKIVNHTYQQSGGYVVQFTVIDQNGCINTNTIDQRVRISPKPNFAVATTPQICVGDTIQLTGSVNQTNSAATINASTSEAVFQPRYERSDSLFLPDGKGVAYETTINITQFNPGQRLTNINDLLGICTVMEHSYMRDLQVSIKCPDGTSVMLQNFEAVGKEISLGEPIDEATNLAPGVGYEYCWTSTATNGTWFSYDERFLSSGDTLPAGNYNSVQSLDSLLGCPLNGQWTITVEDYLVQDNGYIFEWNIGFKPELYPRLEKFEPSIVQFGWETTNNAALQTTPGSAGENAYRFVTTDEFGCKYDTTVLVQALPPTHPDCYTCQDLLTKTEDIVFCDETTANVDVALKTPPQAIKFEAYPNYKQLNNTNHPTSIPYESSISVNSIFPNTIANITQITSVCVDIETGTGNPIGDITLWLVSPDGKRLELSSNNGGNGIAYRQTCFTPNANIAIQSGNAPFTGNFLPEQSWNVLLNTPVNGTWKLLVADNNGVQLGTINSWSIALNATNSVKYNWTAAPELSCLDCPNPSVRSGNAITTSYVVVANDQYNCLDRDTIEVLNIKRLETPQLNCEITTGKALSVEWSNQNGVEYEISLDGQAWFLPEFENYQLFSNLSRNETVTLFVRPIITGFDINCSLPSNDTLCIYDACELELALENAALQLRCFDSKEGMVELSWQNGLSPFVFQIDNQKATPTEETTMRVDSMASGEHYFIVNDKEGCSDTLSVEVTAPIALLLEAELTNPSCHESKDGTIVLKTSGGTPGYTFSRDGILFDNQNNFARLAGGSYELMTKDKNGCETQATFTLVQPTPFSVRIIPDEDVVKVNYGEPYELLLDIAGAQGKVIVDWTVVGRDSSLQCLKDCNEDALSIQPQSTTYYTVNTQDEQGCRSEDKIQVRVIRDYKIYVPNAFSPNLDNENDFLEVFGEQGAKVHYFQVFDRWGEKLYVRENFSVNDTLGWDGTFKGKSLNVGEYAWEMEVEFSDGKIIPYSGSVSLVR